MSTQLQRRKTKMQMVADLRENLHKANHDILTRDAKLEEKSEEIIRYMEDLAQCEFELERLIKRNVSLESQLMNAKKLLKHFGWKISAEILPVGVIKNENRAAGTVTALALSDA